MADEVICLALSRRVCFWADVENITLCLLTRNMIYVYFHHPRFVRLTGAHVHEEATIRMRNPYPYSRICRSESRLCQAPEEFTAKIWHKRITTTLTAKDSPAEVGYRNWCTLVCFVRGEPYTSSHNERIVYELCFLYWLIIYVLQCMSRFS